MKFRNDRHKETQRDKGAAPSLHRGKFSNGRGGCPLVPLCLLWLIPRRLEMKIFHNTVCAIAVLIVLTPGLQAQWPSYPTPAVPKGPDGKPNLTAPAPK